MTTKTVNVPGISCGHCTMTIEREVSGLSGVQSVTAEKETKNVTVSWDPETTDWVVIADHMRDINFPPAE